MWPGAFSLDSIKIKIYAARHHPGQTNILVTKHSCFSDRDPKLKSVHGRLKTLMSTHPFSEIRI